MKKPAVRKIEANRCNKKLLEYCQNMIDNDWVEKAQRKWRKDSVANKEFLDGTEPSYLYRENKYARIIAGYLPQDIPECWRVQCVIEGYNELFEQDKIKKEEKNQIKNVGEKKKTKFNFGKTKGERKK